jgi:hypothetical protein
MQPTQKAARLISDVIHEANRVNWTTRQANAKDKDFMYALNRAAYEDVELSASRS